VDGAFQGWTTRLVLPGFEFLSSPLTAPRDALRSGRASLAVVGVC
jgi:hypothetical protein